LTPAELDKIAGQCRAGIADGSIALRPSTSIGIPAEPEPAGKPVIIYGASWCSACAGAVAYLERRRIPYVERDVEKDASAGADLSALLASVGLPPTRALPVVDVRGTVMIGFNPCVVEKFW
jgi:arsenate reductase-like glutaredoxin family protein